jgi:hypothetical protein
MGSRLNIFKRAEGTTLGGRSQEVFVFSVKRSLTEGTKTSQLRPSGIEIGTISINLSPFFLALANKIR